LSAVLHTKLCDLFEVRYPIIQTAMGWVATPELVAGTANAGAMGFLAVATSRPDEADRAIARTKELTDRPFGVNFLMEQPGAADIVDSIVAHRVKAASYSRSPNARFIERFKEAGILCVPTVGQARHALKAVELGADIVVAQGGEGGGHTGSVPTSLLLPQVVEAVDIPVVAAGGFHSGRGLVAALAYGAVGIAMGTRFLMTAESPVPRATLDRYLAASVTDTRVTREIDGLPHRVLVNELLKRLEAGNAIGRLVRALRSGLAYRRLSGASIKDLLSSALSMRKSERLTRTQMLMAANSPILIQRAMVEGRPAEGVLPSGQVAGVIDSLPSCQQLIDTIIAEAGQSLAGLSKLAGQSKQEKEHVA
jgi:NAD(P)H-dependent flavin oxidoreductase YrpB (nitropropane dioxygenase family)